MTPPNILLITSDQQHWNTLSCIGSEVDTPNLDRLAAQGTLFNRAYCPNPTCTPTRASIITGKHPSEHGAWSLGCKLMESEPTVNDVLTAAGYRTALVGKAHFQPLRSTPEFPSLEAYPTLQDLDFWRSYKGPFYGFQDFELARNHTDEGHVGQHYALWMEEKGFTEWRKHFAKPGGLNEKGQHLRWSIPEEYHYNAWIAERTNAHLDTYRESDQPFFLWASFFDPHPSYLVPEPWDTMYDPAKVTVPHVTPGEHDKNPPHIQLTQEKNPDFSPWRETQWGNHGLHSHAHTEEDLRKDIAVYYGMVSCMDKYIGRILDHLEATGMAENTLVVFTSDHGHYYGHHGLIAKGPFHYEDGVRVPFIVRWPGNVPAGERSDDIQSLVDLAPSFLNAIGVDVPRHMTGRNALSSWCGEGPIRDSAVVEFHHQETAIHMKSLVTERYKITTYFHQPYGELYDLENDPGEVNNLWDDPASTVLKSQLIMKLLHEEMAREPMPMPREGHA